VIDTLCTAIDKAFQANQVLASEFPACPAAQNIPTASLKTYVTDRAGHDRRYAIDARKAEAELGYQAIHGFETRFSQTLAWYLENRQWWE
jgi:dTDP-glucose 4,6-dehydratase